MDEYTEEALKRIGQGIKIMMNDRGYGINALERDSGVSKTIIYKILRGENYEIGSLIKVMRFLKVHLEMSLMEADNNVFTMGGNKPSPN
jgi:predicted transcriptional regulator